jgi:hypothetical protein
MSRHDYSAQDALSLLIQRVVEFDEKLAAEITEAVNAGKEDTTGRRKRKTDGRIIEPYTSEEAVKVALGVIKAYFVHFAEIRNSAHKELSQVLIEDKFNSRWNPQRVQKSLNQGNSLAIGFPSETRVLGNDNDTERLYPVDTRELEQQRFNLQQLERLLDFGLEDDNGRN